MKAEDLLKNRNEFFVSEESLPVDLPAEELLSRLRDSRTTGQLTYHFVEGGLRNVMLTRRTRIVKKEDSKTRVFSHRR